MNEILPNRSEDLVYVTDGPQVDCVRGIGEKMTNFRNCAKSFIGLIRL